MRRSYPCETSKASLPIEDKHEVVSSSSHGYAPRESGRRTQENSPDRKPSSWSSSSSLSSVSTSPPRKRKKSHRSRRSADSRQIENIWAAVSHQGTVLAELLQKHSVPPALSVSLGPHESASAD
ncbi:UNVERIFIED_CONTAM: hypothetical protein FKN15_047935 [Acipenser sinensis]